MSNTVHRKKWFFIKNAKEAFTFVELIVVIGILSVLAGVAVINLYTVQEKASVNATIDTIIADLKDQQMKAMVGDTEGQSAASAYGIHFKSDRYILFRGYPYQPSDTTATTVNVEKASIVSTSFPGAQIVFASGSGEVIGVGSNTNTIVIRDKNNSGQKTISINSFGTVTSIN